MTEGRADRPDAGFALVLALWGVALVGLVGMGYVAAARSRVAVAGATTEQARLTLLAEGAAMSAAAGLLADLGAGRFGAAGRPLDGTGSACSPATGVTAFVSVEDEAGKVNLNLAPPEMVSAALVVAGATEERAATLLAGLLAARDRAAAAPPAEPPPGTGGRRREERRTAATLRAFGSVHEVGALAGGDERLARALVPIVTAHSNRPGLDPAVAPAALVAGLGGIDGMPAAWLSPSERQSFTIRAAAASARAVARVDLVAILSPPPAPGLRVVEWRRDPLPPPLSGWPAPEALPPC